MYRQWLRWSAGMLVGAVLLHTGQHYFQASSTQENLASTDKIFSLKLASQGNSSILIATITNNSPQREYLYWNQYTDAKLLGQFEFDLKNLQGKAVPPSAYGATVFAMVEPHKTVYGVPASYGYLAVDAGSSQVIKFNLAKIFKIKPDDTYTVSLQFRPDRRSFTGFITSNSVTVKVVSLGNQPALSAQSSVDGQSFTYTEQEASK